MTLWAFSRTVRISLSAGRVYSSGFLIGTFAGGSGASSPLVVTFNVNATVARVLPLLRNLTYQNTSGGSLLPRTVQVVMTDGDSGTSQPVWKTVNLSVANTPPIVGLGAPVTYMVASSPSPISPAASITDSQSHPNLSRLLGNNNSDIDWQPRPGGLGLNSQRWVRHRAGWCGFRRRNHIWKRNCGSNHQSGRLFHPVYFYCSLLSSDCCASAENLTFYNTSANPSRLDRAIQVTVRETGSNQDSSPALKIVHISAPNQPPIVDAGVDQTVIRSGANAVAQLDGFVTDDGLPSGALNISWSVLETPDNVLATSVTFSPTGSPMARATFNAVGLRS